MSESEHNHNTYLVIGIDFGTTWSGAAWAISTRPNEITLISDWRSKSTHFSNSPKVPTSISYNRDGAVTSWGFDHDSKDTRLRWFKQTLSDEIIANSSPYSELLSSLLSDMRALGKDPVDVVADYLNSLWTHITLTLTKQLSAAVLENVPLDIFLTIPSYWRHKDQHLMFQAARKSGMLTGGMTRLHFFRESEASANFMLSTRNSLQVGDLLVICDAGGSTVNVISYVIESLVPLRLSERCEPDIAPSGAMYLDEAFKDTVKGILGTKFYDTLSPLSKERIINVWESDIKPDFKHFHGPDEEWVFDIPEYRKTSVMASSSPPFLPERNNIFTHSFQEDNDHWDTEAGKPDVLVLKPVDIERVFGKVCPKIVQLVQRQIYDLSPQKPKAIFLVGGFGSNKYLGEELSKQFPEIQVQQPYDGLTATSRGAVIHGLNWLRDQNRVFCRRHFGVQFHEIFDPEKHSAEDKVWDAVESAWKATKQIRWYLKKDEEVRQTKNITYQWYQALINPIELDNIENTILCSRQDVAPTRFSSMVVELYKLTTQFDRTIWHKLPQHKNLDGVPYRTINYEIQLKVTRSGLVWSIHFEGVEQSRASFDFAHPETITIEVNNQLQDRSDPELLRTPSAPLRASFNSWINPRSPHLLGNTSKLEKLYQLLDSTSAWGTLLDFISDMTFIPRVHLVDASIIEQEHLIPVDRLKVKLEGYTKQPWDWWPLRPPRNPSGGNTVKLAWTCDCGHSKAMEVQMNALQDYVTIRLQPRSDSLRGIPGLVDNRNTKSQSHLSLGRPSEINIPALYTPGIISHTNPSASSAVQPSLPVQAHFRSQAGSKSTSGQNLHPYDASATDISSSPQSALREEEKSRGSHIQMPAGEYVLLGVNRGHDLHLAQIDRRACPEDGQFFAQLKEEYNTNRGILRRWLDVKQFHHCEFVEFEKLCYRKIIRRGKGYPHDIPQHLNFYRYQPTVKQSQWKDPPILPDEFYDRYHGCPNCMVIEMAYFHRCSHFCPTTIERVDRIPKRIMPLEVEAQGQEEAWGLHAIEYTNLVRVVLYHIFMLVGPLVFWGLWLWYWGHEADLQNASIPIVCMVPILSMFWALLKGD